MQCKICRIDISEEFSQEFEGLCPSCYAQFRINKKKQEEEEEKFRREEEERKETRKMIKFACYCPLLIIALIFLFISNG